MFNPTGSMNGQALWLVAIVLLVGLLPRPAAALTFTPTDGEWATWPEYCRARYVVSGAGTDSQFSSRVSPAEVASWQLKIGDGWGALHHYCAGLHKANRASLEPTQQRRAYFLRDAAGEYFYFIERTPSSHPLYAQATAQACSVLDKAGDTQRGLQFCDLAIKAQPANGVGYTAKATVYRRHRQFDEARSVLEIGNRETKGESSEVQYFLGLTCVDQKDFEAAREHAKKAYALGYPLPGLRDRLRTAGYPLH